MIDLQQIRARIAADLHRESRGRDATDYLIPGRIRAGIARDRRLQSHRRERPILPVNGPVTVSAGDSLADHENRGVKRSVARSEFFRLRGADAEYGAICANLTGQEIPADAWEKSRERRAEQDATSVFLAQLMDQTGRFPDRRFYKGENDPNRCSVIDLMTEAVLPLPPIHRLRFLPSSAAGYRAKMLRDVEHFLGENAETARMYTITNGPRVAIHKVQLREDISAFHRRLSKLASKMRTRWGISMQWRATEFGKPQWDAETGQMTLHLHAHILVTEPARTTEKRRAKVRRGLWKLFGVHWDDAGTIENAREFVKYPVKDTDIETIVREAGPGAMMDFYEATRGMRLCTPMGDLKAIRRNRKINAQRVTAWTRNGRRSLEVGPDWNACKRPLADRNNRRAEAKRAAEALAKRLPSISSNPFPTAQTPDSAETGGDSIPKSPYEPSGDEDRPSDGRPQIGDARQGNGALTPVNRVIARLAPAPYGGRFCAPAVVVWGFNGDVQAVLAQPHVARIRKAFAAQYARAYIRADACAPASRAASKGSQRSNNCPDDLGDLALIDAQNDPPGRSEATSWAEMEAFSP